MARPQRIWTLLLLALLAHVASAQEVGTIASLDGTADIGRGGTWTTAAIGSPINLGDQVRTGTPGHVSIVFQDDSVVSVTEGSQLVIDQQVFNPNRGVVHSLIELLRGKLNAVVGDYYHQPGTAFEVRTATAVAGVRGTEFSMSYDPIEELTQVTGVSGLVQVHSLADPTGPGVLIHASEVTTVIQGQLPTAPRRLEETMFRQHIEGIQFFGTGRAESLASGNAVRAGNTVPPSERAPGTGIVAHVPSQGSNDSHHDASNLVGQPPASINFKGLAIAFPR